MRMKRFTIGLLTLVMLLALSTSVFAAPNKGLKAKVTLKKTANKSNDHWESYFFAVCAKTTSKVTKSMTASGDIYIPDTLLKDGNVLYLSLAVNVHTPTFKKGQNSHLGYIEPRDGFLLANDGGKIYVLREHTYWRTRDNGYTKYLPGGKVCQVKNVGRFYVVSIRNAVLADVYWPDGEDVDEPVSVSQLKGTYHLAIDAAIETGDNRATIAKGGSGDVYLDNLSVKAKKTVSVTFDKNDYEWFDCGHDANGKYKGVKGSVANLP